MLSGDTFFAICGAPKAGTTALHQYLDTHPEICMSTPKETDFFQHNYQRGWDWFESCFDPGPGVKVCGEASPGNMIHPQAAERIFHHRPSARLIFILRNPIERAYSQYYYGIMRGTGDSQQSFSDLIRDKDDAWAQRVLELGMYHQQLIRYTEHFHRSQMFIGLYEDFREDNRTFVRQIIDFLGVDASVMLKNTQRENTTRYPHHTTILRTAYAVWNPIKRLLPDPVIDALFGVRSRVRDAFFKSGSQAKPPMDPADRAYLRALYSEPNARLAEWLGRDLSDWP